jgi:hypothetical protein
LIYSLIIIYTRLHADVRKALSGFLDPRIVNFNGVIEYLSIGIPSCATMCIEWWTFEVAILVSGYVGPVDQSVQVLLANLCCVLH